jgi:Uma2 family endonuclease
MKVPEFLAWSARQYGGRYELVDGEVVAQAPERVRHNLVKAAVYVALKDAVKAARLPCTVFTDGVAVRIDDENTREPDASVECGRKADPDSMLITPVIVVEVESPSTERVDAGAKLIDNFKVPSIRHYLIVLPEKRHVVHHERNEAGEITTHIAHDGEVVLDPPGIGVAVAALLGAEAGETGGQLAEESGR